MLECIYFVVVTLSSVGFGDLTPQTDAMRLFTGAYILVGVGILGTALQLVESGLASAASQLGSPASSDGTGPPGAGLLRALTGSAHRPDRPEWLWCHCQRLPRLELSHVHPCTRPH